MKILKSYTSLIIFEDEKETIRKTILNAVEKGIDLRGANLSDANLRGATLSDANLRGANLRGANLRGTDLRGADLRGADLSDATLSDANLRGATLSDANLSDANLRGTDLRGADLRGANLSDASLRGAVGNKKELRTMQLDTYSISFTVDMLQIGCKRFSIEQWKEFDDKTIEEMDKGALEWWNKWKETIFKIIELSFEIKK